MVYVNKIPCNECIPMLYELEARAVVLPPLPDKLKKNEKCFEKLLNDKEISVLKYTPPSNGSYKVVETCS